MCSDLDSLARRGHSPARVDQENRELADAIAGRDDAVVAVARDRARYHAHMAVVEAATTKEAAAAKAVLAEVVEEAAMRVQWHSSLFETLERRSKQDEMSDCRRARHKINSINLLCKDGPFGQSIVMKNYFAHLVNV
jgi:hypothetical protein